MRNRTLLVLSGLLLALASGQALAHGDVAFGFSMNVPGASAYFGSPPPIYVAPPAIVYRAAPGYYYVAPPRAYYAEPPRLSVFVGPPRPAFHWDRDRHRDWHWGSRRFRGWGRRDDD